MCIFVHLCGAFAKERSNTLACLNKCKSRMKKRLRFFLKRFFVKSMCYVLPSSLTEQVTFDKYLRAGVIVFCFGVFTIDITANGHFIALLPVFKGCGFVVS